MVPKATVDGVIADVKRPCRRCKRSDRRCEADTAVIHRYSAKVVNKRSLERQRREREILLSHFHNLRSQKVGQIMRGKSVFQTFIDLYNCARQRANPLFIPELENYDKSKALAGDDTPEDEILAAKRYLQERFQRPYKPRQGPHVHEWDNYVVPADVEVIVIDDDDDDGSLNRDVVIVDVPLAEIVQDQSQCCICSDSTASASAIRCRGSKVHVFCHECFHVLARSAIAEGMAQVRCPMVDEGCTAPFRSDQFTFLNDKTDSEYDPNIFRNLDESQLREDLAATGNSSDVVCPFCMFYREQYPPVGTRTEFQCRLPACRRKSCRLCEKEAHTGKTCQQAQELALAAGHALRNMLDESLTDKTKRRCNKCELEFLLGDGCNKITCECGHVQRYLCGRSLLPDDSQQWSPEERKQHAYRHFNSNPAIDDGRCRLYTNVELFHCRERVAALPQIIDRILLELPGLDKHVLDVVRKEVDESERHHEQELMKQEEKSKSSRDAYRRRQNRQNRQALVPALARPNEGVMAAR